MFKITIASSPQRILDNNLERSLAYFLSDIGYIPRNAIILASVIFNLSTFNTF